MASWFKNPWGHKALISKLLEEFTSNFVTGSGQGILGNGYLLKNESDYTIYYKPEGSGEAIPYPPRTYEKVAVDGVCSPWKKNSVYKVPDRTDIEITKLGRVLPTANSITWVAGGWKDLIWLAERQADGDHGWDAIFEKAQ